MVTGGRRLGKVGYGLHTDGEYRAYALQVSGIAIPEPSTYAFLAGLAALAGCIWRRRTKPFETSAPKSNSIAVGA